MGAKQEILDLSKNANFLRSNEAQTRVSIIERILFEILGWTRHDVNVEERVSEDGKSTFADFVVRTAMAAFVIEAKKVGATFENLPANRHTYIRALVQSAPQTASALKQARDYARKLGLGFAVVTNGIQWIIFPATRTDQVSFENSSAIVFASVESFLESDFDEFVSLLSRAAVIDGALENKLLGRIENQLEERRLNRYYPNATVRPFRTNLFPLVQAGIETAFAEDIIPNDSELLEKCYVSTPERIRFDSRIQMHIARRQAISAGAVHRPMKAGQKRKLDEIIELASAASRPLAVLILGLVGTGKTTFLQYTRNVSAKERFLQNPSRPYPHWLYVDFLKFSNQSSPYDFICRTLKELIEGDAFLSSFERCIRHAYKSEIEALSRGPLHLIADNKDELNRRIADVILKDYDAVAPYVEKILKYAAGNSAVFLIVDNVDQFDPKDTQGKIFSDAMALAQTLKCNLIIAMRDSTYVKNRNASIFDAFDFDPIYIDAPRIDAVLSKRFLVAKQNLAGVQGEFEDPTLGHIFVHDLSVVIDMIQSSVLGTEIGTLIDVFSTSDVRVALRLMREFLQNGYAATARALEIFQREGRYTMPKHDAIRALILGNRTVYEEKYSVVGNPFDARLGRTEAQLLRLYVLSALVASASDSSFQFLEGGEIARCLKEIGFNENTCKKVLADLCECRFIQTTNQTDPSLDSNYVPTRLGGYIVRHLIGDFTFMQHMMMDTFIGEDGVWKDLRDLMDQITREEDVVSRVDMRKKSIEIFHSYLLERYSALYNQSVARKLGPQWCTSPLKSIEGVLKSNLYRASDSAWRNYGPEGRLSQYRYIRAGAEI